MLVNHGRFQKFEDVKATFKMLKDAEFPNISGDVMLGLPGQTTSMVLKTVKFLIKNRQYERVKKERLRFIIKVDIQQPEGSSGCVPRGRVSCPGGPDEVRRK